ncbi:MAG: nitrate reductase molybdenum cofactor assembly chaperone [Desulfobacterales bacterium]
MNDDGINPLRLLSALLVYPDEEWLRQMKDIETALGNLPAGEVKQAACEFLNHVTACSPIDLQEAYTAAFDMNPSTTMNLTYHIYGDTEKRAEVLAGLQQRYQDAGYERTSGELPDYLPLMLEFLSICPDEGAAGWVGECFQGFEDYLIRLRKTAPAYADLLHPLIRLAASSPLSSSIKMDACSQWRR